VKLFLSRHAETEHTREGIVQGHSNSKLSEKGLKQAEALAKEFSQREIDAVYSSDMKRAAKTAEKIADPQGLKVNKSKDLREVDRSSFEVKPFEQMVKEIRESETEDYLWKPENGESLEETKKRAVERVEDIKNNHRGEKIVVISHGGTIGATMMGLMGRTAKNSYKLKQSNCSINRLKWDKKRRWQVEKVNETCHLKNI